jgi:hypothetical protein
MRPLDRLLTALRAAGPDSYRADPEHPDRWSAYCPCCASELIGARSLLIREGGDGRLMLVCWRGCSTTHVLSALRVAELRFPLGWAWAEPPNLVETVAIQELRSLAEERSVVAALRRHTSMAVAI